MASSTAASQTTKGLASALATNPSPSSTSSLATASRQRGSANGVAGRARSQNDSRPGSAQVRETNTPDKHANDRLLFLMANLVGNTAQITVKSGEQFSGIFSTASLPKESAEVQHYVLKMAKRLPTRTQQPNGHAEPSDDYIGYGEDHVLVLDVKDVVDFSVPNVTTDKAQVKLTNGSSAGFRTDSDISGNLNVRERELQRWEPTADSSPDLSFNSSNGPGWDQFETNERLYGVKTDYDETFYTTAIDRSAPSYKQRAAAAEKLAREIEGATTTNTHVAEERGHAVEGTNGIDEEEKFSGVRREFPALPSSQANKYTPPARRAPTGQASISGVPVDPAIISAQILRPDSTAKPSKSTSSINTPAEQAPALPKKENMDPSTNSSTITNAAKEGSVQSIESQNEPTTVNASPTSLEKGVSPQPGPAASKTPGRAPITSANPLPNTTVNVEREVLKEFKSFAQREKQNVNERQKMATRKDRELKLNDLIKFSTNFKLKTAVPQDMLGILAKDKHKQVEIVEKSQRQLEEQSAASKATLSPQPEQSTVQAANPSRAEALQAPPSAIVDQQISKGGRAAAPQPPQTPSSYSGKAERSFQLSTGPVLSPKAGTGNLGQRLLAQPQYRDRTMQSFTGASLTGTTLGTPSRSGSIPSTGTPLPIRLNVQATEFRPNPTAVTFSPSGERSSTTSPQRARKESSSRAVNRVSFFGNKKPMASDKRSIRDAFNPITRMRKEAEQSQRTKEYIANGGIPQSYRTPPTWEVSEENKDKTYVDMFENPTMSAPPVSPPNMTIPHQHQLPLHLQQGVHVAPQASLPNQPLQPFSHNLHSQGRDHRFDDHRMQLSSSQSSQFPSPRMPPVLVPYGAQMMGHMQPQLGQPVGPYPYAAAGHPMGQVRHFPGNAQFLGPQPGPIPGVMVMNPPGGVSFMNQPVHGHPQIFSPGQAHVIPGHVMGPHTPNGPNGYSSPRGAPMMMHQGSQQGHAPPPHLYMSPSQHPGQMYAQQHQAPLPHMRGGIPMTQQQSFGGSNHPQHYPMQQRNFSQFGGNYGPQPTAMDHGMSQQHHPPSSQMNVGGERDDGK